MVLKPIYCPDCRSSDVVKHGRSAAGKQRYCCRNCACSRRSFILNFSYRGRLAEVKQQISHMASNGSGIRAPAREISGGIIPPETLSRVLKISPTTLNSQTLFDYNRY